MTKVRLFELAKDCGVESSLVERVCRELRIDTPHRYLTQLDPEGVARVRAALRRPRSNRDHESESTSPAVAPQPASTVIKRRTRPSISEFAKHRGLETSIVEAACKSVGIDLPQNHLTQLSRDDEAKLDAELRHSPAIQVAKIDEASTAPLPTLPIGTQRVTSQFAPGDIEYTAEKRARYLTPLSQRLADPDSSVTPLVLERARSFSTRVIDKPTKRNVSASKQQRQRYKGDCYLIDGSNVARSETGTTAKLSLLLALVEELRRVVSQAPVKVLADASLRHLVDDRNQYDRLIDDGVVVQTPAGTQADEWLLRHARELHGVVVSNDTFKQFREIRKGVAILPFSVLRVGTRLSVSLATRAREYTESDGDRFQEVILEDIETG